MKITFLGAAGEVTGSQHLIETSGRRILLDCGLFQGRRSEARQKNLKFHCNPHDLDAVILSHAHIDHCGNLPGLYKAGFRGPVFCTDATADVAEIMLTDSAKIQEEDARYLNRHHDRGEPRVEPLYGQEHVDRIVKLIEPLEYGDWHELAPDVRLRFSDAGHILGSAITELEIRERGEIRRVVFTGDLGRRGQPLLHDPQPVPGCDILITECTYGNKVHVSAEGLQSELLHIIKEADVLGGRVIVPAFSLGRTQNLVYFLNCLANEGKLPRVPIFVDSPLSRKLTNVYRHHHHVMDDDVQELLASDRDPFGFRDLTYIGTPDESIALNKKKGAFVVIAASGMCESGRVLHHLKHAVSDPQNTIVIIGFQAHHTLGRRLVEGRDRVRILDREYPLRAKVVTLNGLSAHADVTDFKWWFERLAEQKGIGQAFLVHGEPPAANALAAVLRDYCDEDPIIPELYQSFEV